MVESDSRREDHWFQENERKLLEAAKVAREKRAKERAEAEAAEQRERLKAAHWMKCPKCGHDLREESVDGVMVDRCSHCEGIFLDANELEQLYARRTEDRPGFLRKLIGL